MSLKYIAKPYQEIIAPSFVKSVRSTTKGHIVFWQGDMRVNFYNLTRCPDIRDDRNQ